MNNQYEDPLDIFSLMASGRPEWSRVEVMKWMFQAVGRPDGGSDPVRLRAGFSIALQSLELHMPACASLGVVLGATDDWEVLRWCAAKGRRRVCHRPSTSLTYDIFVAISESDSVEDDIPAAIAAATVLLQYLARVPANRRLLRRIQVQLGVEVDKVVDRHMQSTRWSKCAQMRTLTAVVGQVQCACRVNDRAAARLGLANPGEREESARLTLQLLSSLR